MAWNKVRSLGFILANKYKKNWRQTSRPGILHILGSNIHRSNMVAHKKGKEDAIDLLTESETDNTAS